MAGGDDFIGSGWAFPIRTDSRGAIALVSREQEIEQSIRLIVGTALGERPMRPEFGCAIHDYVFAPASASTVGRIAYEVRGALRRWEPRIDVRKVDVTPDPEDPSKLMVLIQYIIRTTNDPRNLVYPFYVIPGENRAARSASLAPGPGSKE